jgi:hypothetical protein
VLNRRPLGRVGLENSDTVCELQLYLQGRAVWGVPKLGTHRDLQLRKLRLEEPQQDLNAFNVN